MSRTLTGHVVSTLLGQDAHSMISTRQPSVKVTFEGFEGDRHAGLTCRSGGRMPQYARGTEIRNCRQVSIVSDEELAAIASALAVPQLLPEWLGSNLCLHGIPRLTLLPPATRLYFAQGATLVVECENHPCTTSGEAIQMQYPDVPDLTNAFPKVAMHKRGIVAWVECPGVISEGDMVQVEVPEQVIYPF